LDEKVNENGVWFFELFLIKNLISNRYHCSRKRDAQDGIFLYWYIMAEQNESNEYSKLL